MIKIVICPHCRTESFVIDSILGQLKCTNCGYPIKKKRKKKGPGFVGPARVKFVGPARVKSIGAAYINNIGPAKKIVEEKGMASLIQPRSVIKATTLKKFIRKNYGKRTGRI